MKKKEWHDKIKDATIEAGTYQPFFELVIAELAQILETRDSAKEVYEKTGGNPVVMHTNKGGSTNLQKNPALQVIENCNQQALAYWRELGLTVKAYKALGSEVTAKNSTFEEFLEGVGI